MAGTGATIPDLRSDPTAAPDKRPAAGGITTTTPEETMSASDANGTVERNCAVVRRLLDEVWSGGNLAVADELLTDGAFDNDKQPGEELTVWPSSSGTC